MLKELVFFPKSEGYGRTQLLHLKFSPHLPSFKAISLTVCAVSVKVSLPHVRPATSCCSLFVHDCRFLSHSHCFTLIFRLLLIVSQQEATEVPLTLNSESLTNGDLMEAEEDDQLEDPVGAAMGLAVASAVSSDADGDTLEPETMAVQGRAAALIAAARAVVSEEHLKQRLAARGHRCSQCDRVFMSMQGLRSHERSHSAMALFSKEDKYSCQYCQFVSPFRHK